MREAGRLSPGGLTALYLRLRSGRAALRRLVGEAVAIADAAPFRLERPGWRDAGVHPFADARVTRGRRRAFGSKVAGGVAAL